MRSHVQVWRGSSRKTRGGLSRRDLTENRYGKVVSKKKSTTGKKNSWSSDVKSARNSLIKERKMSKNQMVPVGGKTRLGKELYKRALSRKRARESRKTRR